jgi:hypothetical protein
MAPAGRPFGLAFGFCFSRNRTAIIFFNLARDTDAMLFLHDIRVISPPLRHTGHTVIGRVLPKTGWHPWRLLYRHAGAVQPRLQLTRKLAGVGDDLPPAEIFQQVRSEHSRLSTQQG